MKTKINPYIIVFLILFTITNQIRIYLIIMLFDFVHEMTHIIVGRLFKFNIKEFNILPWGFGIEFTYAIDNYNKKIKKSNILSIKKIIVALSGPAINIIIFFISIIYKLDTDILYSNLILGLFNLIPIYPLDGGRIIKNILKIFFGNKKANTYINNINNITAIILTIISSIVILIYKNIAIVVIIGIIWWLVLKENKNYNLHNKVYKVIDKSCNYL